MARTILTPVLTPRATVPMNGLILTLTAWDAANGNRFLSTGKELLLVQNTHASTTYTVTVTSVADALGRTKDIAAFSMVAQALAIFGPFDSLGWMQTDGYIYIDANNAAVKFQVITLP